MEQYFSGIAKTLQTKILETKLTIYECEGEEPEIKEWFKIRVNSGYLNCFGFTTFAA